MKVVSVGYLFVVAAKIVMIVTLSYIWWLDRPGLKGGVEIMMAGECGSDENWLLTQRDLGSDT